MKLKILSHHLSMHPFIFIESYQSFIRHNMFSVIGGGEGGGTRQLLSSLQKAVSRSVQHAVCKRHSTVSIRDSVHKSHIDRSYIQLNSLNK